MLSNVLLLYLLGWFSFGECGRIAAIFPLASRSHYILGSTLLKELAKRGHEVTMISPFREEIQIKNYKQVYLDGVYEFRNISHIADSRLTQFQKMVGKFNTGNMIGEVMLKSENLKKYVDSKPDVDVVIHMVLFSEALLGVAHKLNASVIGFSAGGSNIFTGTISANPLPYAYVPNVFLPYTDKMNFLERTVNTLVNIVTESFLNFMILPTQQSLLTKYFPDAPPLAELIQNIELVLVNSHFSTETPRPYLPNVIQIGGYLLQEKQELPEALQAYLENSNKTIYFSLGSNIESSLLTLSLQDILSVFEEFHHYNFLWKSDLEYTKTPKNVKISKWFPQRAILGHRNVVAFITHGGLGSTVEAIYHGVPMICIPYFGDQHKNTADSVANGYAIHLEPSEINKETFSNAIREITENPSYRDHIKLKSDLYKNQAMNPMDKAVYWIEHVVKHRNNSGLRPQVNVLPFYQMFLLDVFLLIFAVLTISAVILYLSVKRMCLLCCKKSAESIRKIKTA